jgi:flagella basal body P-ring formation protein FlgA
MRVLLPASLVISLTAVSVMADTGGASIRSLPVPAATIYPGELVTPERLTERQFRTTPRSLEGIATDKGEIVGKETRLRLVAGKPIALAGLGIPFAVKRGASVVASYRDEGFSISTRVVTLSDGSEGDIIEARAAETGAIIKVEVLPGGDLAIVDE